MDEHKMIPEGVMALYRQRHGEPTRWEAVPGGGSHRQYFRLWDKAGKSLVACSGTDAEENRCFLYLARHLRKRGLPVPQVEDVADDGMAYLQEDVGRDSLYDALRRGRERGGLYDDEEQKLLRSAMRLLPRVQLAGAVGLDWSQCHPSEAMDAEDVMFDLNYFKYCFLKTCGVDFDERRLQRDLRQLCQRLTEVSSPPAFLSRDFQARNIMLSPGGELRLIDFQGGRRGPVFYDVAAFLWQASARYPDALRRQLVDVYLDALREEARQLPEWRAWTDGMTRKRMDDELRLFVFFRTLQVLGAYGFRGRYERKRHFLDSIPPALDNLRNLLEQGAAHHFPYLEQLLHKVAAPSTPCPTASERETTGKPLTVSVWSFSYKRGIPADESGNGGGYVFDCRSTHNPGRYDEYKHLTGLDAPVIKFLEDDGEITTFLKSVCLLADHHVERYLERGFTHLMFCFGCTGGQHRSVYCAQHLAEHLHGKYAIRVVLRHREQGIEAEYGPQPKEQNDDMPK